MPMDICWADPPSTISLGTSVYVGLRPTIKRYDYSLCYSHIKACWELFIGYRTDNAFYPVYSSNEKNIFTSGI
jgi:hypothetical protein